MKKVSNVISLVKLISKNNLKNLLFLLIFIFFASMLEIVALLCIAPIIKISTGNLEVNDKASSLLENFFPFIDINNPISVFSLLFLFAILASIMMIISNYFSQKIKYQYCESVLKNSINDIFNSTSIFFSHSQQGKLINTFTKELQNIGDSLASISRIASYLLQSLFYLFIIIFLSVKSAFLIFIILILVYSPLFFLGKISRELGKKNTISNNIFFTSLQESFGFFKGILSYGIQKRSVEKISNNFKVSASAAIKSYIADFTITSLFIPLTILGISMIFVFKNSLNISIAEVSIVIITFYRISSRLNLAAKDKNILDKSIYSFDQINEIREIAKNYSLKFNNLNKFDFKDTLSVSNLYQKYDNSEILTNINLNFKKNNITALIGKSGSGKTSLADILSGINKPSAGKVEIDGKNFYDIEYESLRSKICYVSQESLLLNLPIKENIRLYDKNISDHDIYNACKLSNCDEFIQKLPNTYDTYVGERGSRLSFGQIQRISLARAIVRKPEILILDEVTSALDNISEKFINETILKLRDRCTVIIIAHRLSLLKEVDQIYIIENGHVKESGNYNDLISKSKIFKSFVID